MKTSQTEARQKFARAVARRLAAGGVNQQPTGLSQGANSLTAHGQQISIEAVTAVPGAARPGLVVAFEPAGAENQKAAFIESDTPERGASGDRTAGLSYEDQLFRTKWGWQAYDAARRAAFAEANGGSQP